MTEWQAGDPREAFDDTHWQLIAVQSDDNRHAIAGVTTHSSMANPWVIEFVANDDEDVMFRSGSNSRYWDANDNWPDGWKWVALPS